MTARVIPLEDTTRLAEWIADLAKRIDAGDVRAFALVVAEPSGGLSVWWGASRQLGAHAGSILRGAVAYLGARMDVDAITGA
jgi:hypothetical protein